MPEFRGVESGASYDKINTRLSNIIEQPGTYHAVGLIFGRPTCEQMKVILGDLDYFHNRSDKHISLFCVGYALGVGQFQPIVDASSKYGFDSAAFTSCLSEFEDKTSWRYSGETDLLLLGAYKDDEDVTRFDFTTVVVVCLENAIREKAIPSTRQFIEDVILLAKTRPSQSFAFDLGDAMGPRKVGSWLKEVVFEVIAHFTGIKFGEVIGKATIFCVKDLSTKELQQIRDDSNDEQWNELISAGKLTAEQAGRVRRIAK